MLSIVLFILKLLGILVLILLGLALGVILLILFVPVRYRIEGSYDGRPNGRGRITWLLHMVSVTAAFEDEFSVVVRLFGFRILKPQQESREDAEDMLVQAMEVTGEDAEHASETVLDEVEKAGKERLKEEEGKDSPAPTAKKTDEKASDEPQEDEPQKDEPPPPVEKSKTGRRAKHLSERLTSFKKRMKASFDSLSAKLLGLKEKKDELQAWISDKDNQKTVKLLIRQVKKLLRHLLPKKGKGEVVFGFDDPYTTGQVLTAASIIYPYVHDKLDLYPVFDRTVFTAQGYFKGRIRIGTLLCLAGRMLLDKNFRILLKKWLR